jgi:GNAT superfamily N-acetyltransferase
MSSDQVIVASADPESPAALELMARLTRELAQRYDDDGGVKSFQPADAKLPRAVFLIAWQNDQPLGCGALRPLTEEVAEVKRMYVDPSARGLGIGQHILTALEEHAQRFGYRSLKLETGTLQPEAIRLYEKAGFQRCTCYGYYADDPRSVCFEKHLETPTVPTASCC